MGHVTSIDVGPLSMKISFIAVALVSFAVCDCEQYLFEMVVLHHDSGDLFNLPD